MAAILLLVAGSVLMTYAALIRARVNPAHRFPFWSNPPIRPLRANLLQGLAGGLFVLGGVLAFPELGYITMLLILAGAAGPLLVIRRHNQSVSA